MRGAPPMPPAESWHAVRPGDHERPGQPIGNHLGRPGPDAGFGLKLAHRFASDLELAEGEMAHDAVAVAFVVGTARATLFSRAPMVHDMEFAFTLLGYLGGAPDDLVEYRRGLVAGASHHYWDRRNVVDLVPESVLRLTPAQVRGRLGNWRDLFAGWS